MDVPLIIGEVDMEELHAPPSNRYKGMLYSNSESEDEYESDN